MTWILIVAVALMWFFIGILFGVPIGRNRERKVWIASASCRTFRPESLMANSLVSVWYEVPTKTQRRTRHE